jgi:hypothetical protein
LSLPWDHLVIERAIIDSPEKNTHLVARPFVIRAGDFIGFTFTLTLANEQARKEG